MKCLDIDGNEIKAGDVVVCKDARGLNVYLTEGAHYKVLTTGLDAVGGGGGCADCIRAVGDDQRVFPFLAVRFCAPDEYQSPLAAGVTAGVAISELQAQLRTAKAYLDSTQKAYLDMVAQRDKAAKDLAEARSDLNEVGMRRDNWRIRAEKAERDYRAAQKCLRAVQDQFGISNVSLFRAQDGSETVVLTKGAK